MRSCSLFSLAVVALSFVSLTGCAHTSQVKATGLTGANAPLTKAMQAAGNGETAPAGYTKRGASPLEQAMNQAQGGYAKQAQ